MQLKWEKINVKNLNVPNLLFSFNKLQSYGNKLKQYKTPLPLITNRKVGCY